MNYSSSISVLKAKLKASASVLKTSIGAKMMNIEQETLHKTASS